MAKKSKTTKTEEFNFPAFEEETVVEETTAPDTINTDVKLQSLVDARLHYTGQETGKSYLWERGGSIVPVLAEDAPYLLSKKSKSKACCSGNSSGAIFQEVE